MGERLTPSDLAELHALNKAGAAKALEWRAAVLAAHPFLLVEVEQSRAEIAALREQSHARGNVLLDTQRENAALRGALEEAHDFLDRLARGNLWNASASKIRDRLRAALSAQRPTPPETEER